MINSNTRDYFFTWSKQSDALHFSPIAARECVYVMQDGSEVYDLVSTNFQAAFGHSSDNIKSRISYQLSQMPIASPKATFQLKDVATQALLTTLNLGEGKIFYTVSGAEAVENALKMARQISGKSYVLARTRSYHGASLGAVSVTGDWRAQEHLSLKDFTLRIPEPEEDPDLIQTRKLIEENGPEKIAAFCLETITGMNGVIAPPKKWWDGIQSLADEFNILLILDEVTCGFGRTGANFAFQHYQLRPNFVCMAKAITGGYIPFGALWVDKISADYYQDRVLTCGLTNYAHPLGLAAMMGVMEYLHDSDFCSDVVELERAFHSALNQLKAKGQVRGIRQHGMLAAIDLEVGPELSWQKGIEAGIHVATKQNTVVVAPPLVMKTDQLNDAMIRLSEVIRNR